MWELKSMHKSMAQRFVLISLAVVLTFSAGCSDTPPPKITRAPSSLAPTEPTTPGSSAQTSTPKVSAVPTPPTVFAVIGDYGTNDKHERKVAKLVKSWVPLFVVALGDDYYKRAGGKGTAKYDRSTGKYYGTWLKDIHTTGENLPKGKAKVNAFFPALGNHDYVDATPAPRTYLRYFTLPGKGFRNTSGNERYYDFVQGPVHFFVLNSNPDEPDGTSSASRQARWLKKQLADSTSPWNIVYDHHPPYSSDDTHGSTDYMQWPFAKWGADVVMSGHAHTYERIRRKGVVYFVNGLGGAPRYQFSTDRVTGSKKRYRADWGAQRVSATDKQLEFSFYNSEGKLKDRYTLSK